MRKFTLILGFVLACISLKSEIIVYEWRYSATSFEQKTGENIRKPLSIRGFLVLNYDSTEKVYTEKVLVKYWLDSGKKYQATEDYIPDISEINSTPSRFGGTWINKMYQENWNNILFEFQSSYEILPMPSYNNKMDFPGALLGQRIVEKSDDIGQRSIVFGRVYSKLAVAYTIRFMNDASALTAVAFFQGLLYDRGYFTQTP